MATGAQARLSAASKLLCSTGSGRRVLYRAPRSFSSLRVSADRSSSVIVEVKTDMIELAVRIIETQQQRADLTALALKSKATNYAVRRSQSLRIDHDAFARLVNILQTIGNHTIGGPSQLTIGLGLRPLRTASPDRECSSG